MAKKIESKTKSTKNVNADDTAVEHKQESSGIFDYFRFGESYTSLILGILVVIIATGLLLGFVHNRNSVNKNISQPQVSQNLTTISQSDTETVMTTATKEPTATSTPIPTVKPTAVPTIKPVATKTPKPTSTPIPTRKVVVVAKPTSTPIPTIKITQSPISSVNGAKVEQGRTYVVRNGDNLWNIAIATYKSGYNWVDIARANNLSNPDSVNSGDKLVLPAVEQKNATSEADWKGSTPSGSTSNIQAGKIVGDVYTIQKGDNLWNISIRAYGDGYKWVEVAKANNLSNPNLIYPGTSLKLPRK